MIVLTTSSSILTISDTEDESLDNPSSFFFFPEPEINQLFINLNDKDFSLPHM